MDQRTAGCADMAIILAEHIKELRAVIAPTLEAGLERRKNMAAFGVPRGYITIPASVARAYLAIAAWNTRHQDREDG